MTLFAGLGLRPAPGYFSADFWKAEQQDDILAREMYVATGGWDYMTARAKTRMELAGQIIEADGLSDAEMQQFAHTLQELCVQALAEGVRADDTSVFRSPKTRSADDGGAVCAASHHKRPFTRRGDGSVSGDPQMRNDGRRRGFRLCIHGAVRCSA